MNLRQKNKKLKQELEHYKKLIVRPTVLQTVSDMYAIRTFAVRKEFTEEQLNFFDADDIVQILMDEIEPAIVRNLRIRTSESRSRLYYGNKLFTGEITLAIPKD